MPQKKKPKLRQSKPSRQRKPRKILQSHVHPAPKNSALACSLPAHGKKPLVMVVDDEENIIILIKDLLEQEGLDVTTASNGMKCLDMLEHEKPDLLMLDVMMPGITGLDVAEAVRLDPRLRHTRIIFMTVVRETEIKPQLLNKLAASDYISKPFDNEDFVRRVKWTLTRK